MQEYYKAQVILGDDGFPLENKLDPVYRTYADLVALATLPTKQVALKGNELHVYGIDEFSKKDQQAFIIARQHGVKCFKPHLIYQDWPESSLMAFKANNDEALRKAVALSILYRNVLHSEQSKYLRDAHSTMYYGLLLGYDPADIYAWHFGTQLTSLLYTDWYSIPHQELATLKRQLAQTASVAKQYFDKAFMLAQQELERFLKSKKVKDAVKKIRPHIVDF